MKMKHYVVLIQYCNNEYCLIYLDIGDPKSNKSGFNGADDIADWFKNDKSDDWRQRD